MQAGLTWLFGSCLNRGDAEGLAGITAGDAQWVVVAVYPPIPALCFALSVWAQGG